MNGNDFIEASERLDKPIEDVTVEDVLGHDLGFVDLPVEEFNRYVDNMVK